MGAAEKKAPILQILFESLLGAAMKFAVRKINWDTDGEHVPGLPKKMDVDLDDDKLDWDDVASLVVDAATDQTGYCIVDAEVKAYVDTAPPGFDARAFNQGKPKKVNRMDSFAAFDELGASTSISLKKSAARILNVAKPEVWRIDFDMRSLDPMLEPDELMRKVDEWVGGGGRFIYVLETDADISFLDSARVAFSEAKIHERDGRAYARLNDVNKVLYVGSSSSLGRRFREHLGYGARGTYALHMCQWARHLFIRVSLVAARYPVGMDPEILGLMEDQLWDTLRPMFGRRGRR